MPVSLAIITTPPQIFLRYCIALKCHSFNAFKHITEATKQNENNKKRKQPAQKNGPICVHFPALAAPFGVTVSPLNRAARPFHVVASHYFLPQQHPSRWRALPLRRDAIKRSVSNAAQLPPGLTPTLCNKVRSVLAIRSNRFLILCDGRGNRKLGKLGWQSIKPQIINNNSAPYGKGEINSK